MTGKSNGSGVDDGAEQGKRNGRAKVRSAILAAAAVAPSFDMPNGFEMRKDGIYRVPAAENAFPFRVCGPLDVIAESRPENHEEWGLVLKWNDRDKREHEWVMPRRLLAGDAMEVRARLVACGFSIGARDAARRALVEFLTEVKVAARVRTVPRTGWYRPESGGAAFVLPGRTLGSAAGEVVRLDLDPAPAIYRERDTLAAWRKHVAAACTGNSRLLFGVSCAFAGPLLPLTEDEGGGINFRGASSRGKTTVIDAAASVWGAPSKTGPNAFTRNWRLTDNAMEAVALAHNHVVLPLDELAQADPATLAGSLYMLANGEGKGRGRAAGGNRPTVTWLTLVLSSSEESAARLIEQVRQRVKAGQEVRMLDIPAEAPGAHGVFEDLHGMADGSAFVHALRAAMVANHGTAGPAFVEWLAKKLMRSPDFAAVSVLPRVTAWCRAEVPAGADGQVQRAARRIATIAVAGELATEAGITGWAEGEASDAAAVIFRAWQSDRGGLGSREDHHLFAAFRRFLALHGSARFDTVRDAKPGEQTEGGLPDGGRIIARAGWRWRVDVPRTNDDGTPQMGPGGFAVTEQRWAYGIVPEVFDAEVAGPLGMEGREARARLGKAGLIEGEILKGVQRWTLKPRRIPGVGRPRMVITAPAAIEGDE